MSKNLKFSALVTLRYCKEELVASHSQALRVKKTLQPTNLMNSSKVDCCI